MTEAGETDLPATSGPFDLVTSLGLLDTINDLPGALALIRRALRPDGLFLAAFAGAGSLPRLRRAMRAAEGAEGLGPSPRIHPQIDVRAAGDLLVRAGFALPVVDRDVVEVLYPSLAELVADLRAMGATNSLARRSRRPFTKLGLAAAAADFGTGDGGAVRDRLSERLGAGARSAGAGAAGQRHRLARRRAQAALIEDDQSEQDHWCKRRQVRPGAPAQSLQQPEQQHRP